MDREKKEGAGQRGGEARRPPAAAGPAAQELAHLGTKKELRCCVACVSLFARRSPRVNSS